MFGTFSKGQGIRKNEAASGDIPCIRYGEIYTHHNDVVRTYNSHISRAVAATSKKITKGDLLFAGSGETKAEIGKAVAFLGDEEVYAGGDIVIFSPRQHCSEFLGYLLNSPGMVRQKASRGQGDAVVHISATALSTVLIPNPPLSEQRAIAAALGDMDALLDGLDRLIAKKRDLKQAAMQQLLTGQTRLPDFSGEWEVKQLGDMSPMQRGFDLLTSRLRPGPFPVVYSNGVSSYHSEFMVKGPGVITGRSGTIGNVHFVEDDFWPHNTSLWVTSFKGNSPRFIFYLLSNLGLDRFSTGSGVPTLNRNDVHEHRVLVPPTEIEQTAIAAVLSDMDVDLKALEARREKTRNLKQAMMQELLTGRTRLVEPASNVIPVDFSAKAKPAADDAPAAKAHNWAINEAVVVAVLVKQFGSEQYPLGRKRCTKLSYLMHRHVEHVAQGYLKKAAGPYNPSVKYKGPEGIAQKNGYIRTHSQGKFAGFVAAEKIAQAVGYFEKWYGPDVLAWLEQFRYKSNDELELLATVDMAVEDLRRAGKPADVDTVKSVIHDNPEWEAKLEREIFSDANIARAITQTRELFQ